MSVIATTTSASETSGTGVWRLGWPMFALCGVLGLLFLGVFHFVLLQQHAISKDSADWSHAYFVPVISLYMLWRNREALVGVRPGLFWPGLVPLVMSLPCYALFQVFYSNHMGQGFSLILGLFGLLLLLLGPGVMQVLFLPLAFLVFGFTISERVMIDITFKLQGIAAHGGYVVLNAIGITTDLQGHTLEVVNPSTGEKIPLNIAEACSGMRMVIAFAALGVAVALIELKGWWQRLALIMAGLPVALAMNIVRVAVLGVASLSNPEYARGEAHMFIGFLMLGLAFVIFMGIAWALNKVVSEGEPEGAPSAGKGAKGAKPAKAAKAAPKPAWALPAVTWATLRSPGFVAASCVLLAGAVGLNGAIVSMRVHLRKLEVQAPDNRQVSAVPRETASWIAVGLDQQMPAEMIEELGTSNYLSRRYVRKGASKNDSPVALELHLAYYTGMIDTVPHVPERCMTGAGFLMTETAQTLPVALDRGAWRVDDDASKVATQADPDGTARTIYFARTGANSDRPNTRVRLPRGIEDLQMRFSSFAGPAGGKAHAAYFFMANGGLSASADGVRLLAFRLEERYAYYLKVQVGSSQVESPEALAREAASLLGELLPEIARCAPDWIEVQRGTYPADNPLGARAQGAAPKP
jgi:exosortase